MVQADISQLSRECNNWRDSLRNYRDELNNYKNKLQELARGTLSKDDLTEVEHYHNQFHIQLINIHDLKQAIKTHDRKVVFETGANNGSLHEETLADHERLYDEYQHLDQTLQELRQEFDSFSGRAV